jgi:hypothetical protein
MGMREHNTWQAERVFHDGIIMAQMSYGDERLKDREMAVEESAIEE